MSAADVDFGVASRHLHARLSSANAVQTHAKAKLMNLRIAYWFMCALSRNIWTWGIDGISFVL